MNQIDGRVRSKCWLVTCFACLGLASMLLARVATAEPGVELTVGARELDSRWKSLVAPRGVHGAGVLTFPITPLAAIVASTSGSNHPPTPEVSDIVESFWTYDYAGGLRLYPFGAGSPNDGPYIEAGAGVLKAHWSLRSVDGTGTKETETRASSLWYAEVGYRWRMGDRVWFSPRIRSSWLKWKDEGMRIAEEHTPEMLSADVAISFGRR